MFRILCKTVGIFQRAKSKGVSWKWNARVSEGINNPGFRKVRHSLRSKFHIMARILIIAYGNPMRCDDGLAWRAADELEGKFSSKDVEILRTHQLTPELADTVSHCKTVIFVDAASPVAASNSLPGEVRCAQIGLPKDASPFSHQLSPGAVIALARQLYAACPLAFSMTLTGECFDQGESLSPAVAAALPVLVARIRAMVQQLLSSEGTSDTAISDGNQSIESGQASSTLL